MHRRGGIGESPCIQPTTGIISSVGALYDKAFATLMLIASGKEGPATIDAMKTIMHRIREYAYTVTSSCRAETEEEQGSKSDEPTMQGDAMGSALPAKVERARPETSGTLEDGSAAFAGDCSKSAAKEKKEKSKKGNLRGGKGVKYHRFVV